MTDPGEVYCYRELRCGDIAEGAALGLLGLITGISQENYCSGWNLNVEYYLWQINAGTGYGRGAITERQSTLLRLLAEECEGWWAWPDDKDQPTFLPTKEWLQLFNKRLHGTGMGG